MGEQLIRARRWLVLTAVGLAGCTSGTTKPGAAASPSVAVSSSSVPGPAVTAPATPAAPVTTAAVVTTVATTPTSTVESVPFRAEDVGHVTIEGPITAGKGAVVMGSGTIDLASIGYVEDEYFVSGTASAYSTQGPLGSDGRWTVTPIQPLPFTTRVVVRRPADPAKFNGSVAVEWLNVSAGFDSSPDWGYAHTELTRSGWAWVGVSAQQVGIVGKEGSLVPLALQQADPVRYASLVHPGDSYSYDIFTQAGAAVRTQFATLLGGAEPQRVIAIGESQSAFRLTTYVDAVAPVANVFDGYLVHSRAAAGAPLTQAPLADVAAPDPTLIRTDLIAPVFTVVSETDVLGRLGYLRARQPDTDRLRVWEVAGTAHADSYSLGIGDTDDGSGAADTAFFASMSSPPASVYNGIISCDRPINTGPHTYVLRSALASLEAWVRTGAAPPVMPVLESDATGAPVLDEHGNGRGGTRTPHVDVPIATLSGLGQSGGSFCGLFGTTVPFDAAVLSALYPDHQAFVSAWNAAVDRAVTSGALLEIDAAHLRSVAAASSIGTPG